MAALGAKIPASAVTALSWYPSPGLWLCQNLVSCERMQTTCSNGDFVICPCTNAYFPALSAWSLLNVNLPTRRSMHCKLWSLLKLLCGNHHAQQDHIQDVNFVFEYRTSVLRNVISVFSWLKQSVSHVFRHEGEGSGGCSFSDEVGC